MSESDILRFGSYLSRLHAVEVHHTIFTYGSTHALSEYLTTHTDTFVFIEHPFEYVRFYPSVIKVFKKGKLQLVKKLPNTRAPEFITYFINYLQTLWALFVLKRRYQLYIGTDSINVLAGATARILGITERVVFYVIDYSPVRYDNPLKNIAYHALNRVACNLSDLVWCNSKMIAAVIKGYKMSDDRIVVVPTGSWLKANGNFTGNNRMMVFVGSLFPSKGVELAIEALQLIKTEIPNIKLRIIGKGPHLGFLKRLVDELGLNDYVEFMGFIRDQNELLKLLCEADIGIAPYVPSPTQFSFFADPGKIKTYLAAGLPVIITRVPQIAGEIAKARAGLAIGYDKVELANAVIELLRDDNKLVEYKKHAIELGNLYSWDTIFRNALVRTINF